MKVLGTNILLGGKQLNRMKELGYKGSHNQFRIICKCRGMADANRKCQALGAHENIFRRGWYSETGNKKELELCESKDVWISVDGPGCSENYVPAEEVFCEQ